MKVCLLHQDAAPSLERCAGADDLVDDLGLDLLFETMADGDELVERVARDVVLMGCADLETIRYRQRVLQDCLREPDAVRHLYGLAARGEEADRAVRRGFFAQRPEATLTRAVNVLQLLLDTLRDIERAGRETADRFRSEGFTRLFATLAESLGPRYLDEIGRHLQQLRFSDGVVMSARLGTANQGMDYVLRSPRPENRTFWGHPALRRPTFAYTIADRDEAGFRALGDLRDRGLLAVANATERSMQHVLDFLASLRSELAYYLGCVNLHRRLTQIGATLCFPDPRDSGRGWLDARGLYDVGLALVTGSVPVGNDVTTDGPLVVVTGANQGGKSTFLRSVGLAAVMMGAGMPVGARSLAASVPASVHSHFRRGEDVTMTHGRLDEELDRMSAVVDRIGPGALLLCNEPFASTNEREGAQIGRDVVRAMVDRGVRVVLVTHLFELARTLGVDGDGVLFLRAERRPDGERTFRVVPGRPEPTSHGEDVYARVFRHSAERDLDAPMRGRLTAAQGDGARPWARPRTAAADGSYDDRRRSLP